MGLSFGNLYCTPQDVMDMVGIDATQLRLDDRRLATGQIVTTTSPAVAGQTTLAVQALQYPLLNGCNIVFDGAGLTTPVECTLASNASVGATSLLVVPLGSDIPFGAAATDNGTTVYLAGLAFKACRYATSWVRDYCCGRYDDSDLFANAQEQGSVNRWATVYAARWIAKRGFQSASQSVDEDYKEALEQVKAVKAGQLNIADIGTRTSGWPFMSNLSIDDRYTYRRLRVEYPTSEPTPTQYAQAPDWNSYVTLEW